MKKSLVLAMAMALGVTASAYAANPFSDVPAGHWAYDSISKLAAAGIIEGYGDDTFRGDRLMTRYEMAQIVAKALAKGGNVDKLAAEFADELDALGVRVAALEKKSDNVRITGYFRYHYGVNDVGGKDKVYSTKLRSRIWFNGKVNDNWNYVGMLQNDQDLKDNAENPTTEFQRAYLQGRLGGLKTFAGRFNKFVLDDFTYNNRMDGVDFTYGNKVKLNAFYGKPTAINAKRDFKADENKFDRFAGASFNAGLGKADLNVGYVYGWDGGPKESYEDGLLYAGLGFKLGKDATLNATYLHSNLDAALEAKGASDNGFMAKLAIKGAKAAKPGSWGLTAKYYYAPAGMVFANSYDTGAGTENALNTEGFKGWYGVAKYTVAKNMVAGFQYWDLKGRETGKKNRATWADFIVTF